MRFTIELDPLIDEAYVEVKDSMGNVIAITNPTVIPDTPGNARWKIDMISASQIGQTFAFDYNRNDEDLLISVVEVRYGGVEYPLKSELFVNKLH